MHVHIYSSTPPIPLNIGTGEFSINKCGKTHFFKKLLEEVIIYVTPALAVSIIGLYLCI